MKKIIHSFLFFLLAVLLAPTLLAQSSVTGVVKNDKQQPIAGASVTLHKKNSSSILAFAITDKEGKFTIVLNGNDNDSLELKAALLGYSKQNISFLPSQKKDFQFTLLNEAITLPEVKVKNPPVWQRKDTINYNVSEFKQQQDRVIGDIIARLPGVEVSPNGQIKYNGKPINKYYIEGLDLLEDKYGLANNNIPAESVDKVQILENHQPIRVLDSVSYSDRAALNIKLKSNAKMRVIGRAKIGVGSSPLLAEDEATPMLFKKKLQFINTYKYNNTGLDNSRELTAQNFSDYINAIQNGASKRDLVSVIQPGPPSFSSNRYLFNNAHVASVNVLVPLSKDYQLRINTSYVNDFQRQQSNLLTKFYLPTDTIVINEANNFHVNMNKLQTEVSLIANTPKFYLKNNTKYEGWWQNEKSYVLANQPITQQLSNPFFNIANDFRLLKTKTKHITEFGSFIGFTKLPQQLSIFPGLYETILNSGSTYDAMLQKATLKTFFTDNYISLRKRNKRISSQYKLGFNIQTQQLESSLLTEVGGIEKLVADTFQNNLQWHRYRLLSENNWTYETNKIRLSFSLPINFTKIDYNDPSLKVSQERQGFFANPGFTIMYQLTPKWNINSSLNYNQGFGDIMGITSGYVLKTYRNLSNNNAPLAETQSVSAASSFTFRNPLKVVFFYAGVNWSHNLSNLLYQQQFNGNLETLLALLQNNYSNRTSVNSRFSKYIIDWKTSIAINAGYTYGNQQQLQQNKLITFLNKNYNAGISISAKISDKFTSDYAANFLTYSSKSKLQPSSNNISSANQNFSFNYFPSAKWIIRLTGEHYYLNNNLTGKSNYFFTDGALRYKPKKSKIDYELLLQNLTNTKAFTAAMLSNNIETISAYQLRPRQVLLKMSFSF